GLDGKMMVTNFTATGYSATEGVDFTVPQGLSATWEAGEGGVKMISIPLVAHPEALTNRFFMMSADTQVEGALQPVRVDLRFGMMILPRNTDAFLAYRRPTLVNGKLEMEALGVQGTTIELLKAPTVDGPWTVAAESGGVDGLFPFEADVNAGAKAEFFQFRQKP
ncbi:MAG TPA: hypothetical protein VMZ30_10925, partial [Pyrinomonadaceae bacterium]|nr:hypothetical protein [Pyrinomonadaceae bacterium]